MHDNKKLYSLRKCRHIMKQYYAVYRKRKHSIPKETATELQTLFEQLDEAVTNKNRSAADELARKLDAIGSVHLQKSISDYIIELGFALILALVIATIVRQMWFELYEIPTGSMRPTFEEQDRLTVTKTAFGINIPLVTEHLYFDPDLVQRTGVVIFSGDNIDLDDTDTKYFYLFPAKKRYIKRLIGKPGDSLYFYGGKIYGVDKEGNPIDEYQNSPWMEHLEHIPFLSFNGKVSKPDNDEFIFRHMNKRIGRLILSPTLRMEGQVLVGGKWIKDDPLAALENHQSIKTFSDFYGIRNFAMARLLTKKELDEQEGLDKGELGDGELYLELSHTPSLSYPPPLLDFSALRSGTIINTNRTVIPLKKEHVDKLMDNMYTARFVVKNGYATRYTPNGTKHFQGSPKFSDVPDGTYEFYFGKGWQIGWGGIAYALPEDHPLYNRSIENIQNLFNMGIELSTYYAPYRGNRNVFPNRYAYFSNGNLYLLGAPIMTKDEETLKTFNEREKMLTESASRTRPYIPFKDYGPPLKDNGDIDVDFIRTFGITVPEKKYLVLGDNHAMSADSRIFGFVPQENLEGAPSLIIWPPGDRIGRPLQKPYPIFSAPRITIWSVALVVALIVLLVSRKRIRKIKK